MMTDVLPILVLVSILVLDTVLLTLVVSDVIPFLNSELIILIDIDLGINSVLSSDILLDIFSDINSVLNIELFIVIDSGIDSFLRSDIFIC